MQEASHLARAALCTVLGGPGAAQTPAESRGGRHQQRPGRGQLGIVRSEEEARWLMKDGRCKVWLLSLHPPPPSPLSYLLLSPQPLSPADSWSKWSKYPHLSRSSSCCSAGASSPWTGACSGWRGRPWPPWGSWCWSGYLPPSSLSLEYRLELQTKVHTKV